MHHLKHCGRPLYDGEKCICHSEKEDKDLALFQQELDKLFADEQADYYDLTSFFFPKSGYKLPRKYKKDIYFITATFSGNADFGWATFSGRADFGRATFSGNAYFQRATFSRNAIFSRVTFSGEAGFGVATFSGEAWFYSTQFEKGVSFLYCKAYDAKVIFNGEGLQRENKEMFPVDSDFRSCSFAAPQNITFRKVSLAKCRFLETDVTRVQFIDVTWANKPKLFKWFPRRAVYDELARHRDYNLTAQLYRRLQKNYMDNFQYAEAGHFYIGEQEMVRKSQGSGWWIWRRIFCTNFLYKIISYYGESFILPLFWILAVLFLFPLYLVYDGLIAGGFWDAFWKNLSFVTVSRPDVGKYLIEPYQQGLVILEGLLLIILVTFLILALRRKYKRKTF